ncbi:hypothetical protein E2C01_069059 [Portunus trituberculatus]|uniref:Uncharacterized protein n=1 Tax=Portunus trituberculatus TaxID=210409 RepID=A0A5B7HZL2_PORTR|nr:hypothetical protein [Portunus trituberculatus]
MQRVWMHLVFSKAHEMFLEFHVPEVTYVSRDRLSNSGASSEQSPQHNLSNQQPTIFKKTFSRFKTLLQHIAPLKSPVTTTTTTTITGPGTCRGHLTPSLSPSA